MDAAPAPSPPAPTPPRRRHRAGQALLALATLLLTAIALLWAWSGSRHALVFTLAQVPRFLPADHQWETRDIEGTLRSGGRLGGLRWSSPDWVVEVQDLHLAWNWTALLQGHLPLSRLTAGRIEITPQGPDDPAPATPPDSLALPMGIDLTLQVDLLRWAGTPAAEARNLAGRYRFDGQRHHLDMAQLDLAQGRYQGSATLEAQTPMALQAQVQGSVDTPLPGGRLGPERMLQAHAEFTLQGTLATPAAQLQLQARLRTLPPSPEGPAAHTAPPAPRMQADLHATLAPWATQPLVQAEATVDAIDLAALWPGAPQTRLHGQLKAGAPRPDDAAPWRLELQLRNSLSGPWDQSRLPLSALQANALYDGARWSMPSATASVGTGRISLQGHYTPATGALEGQAQLHQLPPEALHSALAAAPLSGQIHAAQQDTGVRFQADLRAAALPQTTPSTPGPRTARERLASPPLSLQALHAQGQWRTQPQG
ncbi:MAG: DUF490 domain-containing protein, partial [Burkholderiaceae bacterium]|nr:DUF490 domain-containing protein [Burkholderiaceae bacterium]